MESKRCPECRYVTSPVSTVTNERLGARRVQATENLPASQRSQPSVLHRQAQISGGGLAVIGAVGLLYGLFAPWYSILGGAGGLPGEISASAFDIHPGEAYYLLVGAVSVLVAVAGASASSGLGRGAVRFFRNGVVFWAYAGVVAAIYCFAATRPNIFSSFFTNLDGGNVQYFQRISHFGYGAYLSLGSVLAMAIGITLFVRAVPPPPKSKACPACAEKVNGKAVVCKYCGYRWAKAAASTAP
jgi:hypothetical protein